MSVQIIKEMRSRLGSQMNGDNANGDGGDFHTNKLISSYPSMEIEIKELRHSAHLGYVTAGAATGKTILSYSSRTRRGPSVCFLCSCGGERREFSLITECTSNEVQ